MLRKFAFAVLGCLGVAVSHPASADFDGRKTVYLVGNGTTAIVWKDYDAWLGGMLIMKTAPDPAKIVPLWACVTKSGTKVSIVARPTEYEAIIILIDGDRVGCMGFTPTAFLSNSPAAKAQ